MSAVDCLLYLLVFCMARMLFTCAYDGAPWHGWQSQSGGGTVQDCIETAFSRILKVPLRIHAAGRTDAGVHALAQCFHADIAQTCRMGSDEWCAALNALLPPSVRILSVLAVPSDFHARFNARGKEYEYRICCDPILQPHLAGRVWHYKRRFNTATLRRALRLYCGEHDFRHFAARRGNEPQPIPPTYFVRTIFSASSTRRANLLTIRFCGSGFLYRMVRMMVGMAMQVASGAAPLDDIREALSYLQCNPSCFCAPPGGLYLTRVFYDLE